jgi:hypothetical protein
MQSHQIEAWALNAIDRVRSGQPNDDARVELEAGWPDDPKKAARRIAGHANAARGTPILWMIGVDEVNVSAGDVVVLAKYSGTEVKIEGEEHLIVDADDILGMMEG